MLAQDNATLAAEQLEDIRQELNQTVCDDAVRFSLFLNQHLFLNSLHCHYHSYLKRVHNCQVLERPEPILVSTPVYLSPSGATFDPMVEVSIPYLSVFNGIKGRRLMMSRFNIETGEWLPRPTTSDATRSIAKGMTSSFSMYAVFSVIYDDTVPPPPPPPPPPPTYWQTWGWVPPLPPLVLSGHAASLTPYSSDTPRPSRR